MALILDGLLAFTVIYFVHAAHKRGVVKSVLGLASLVVSYIAATMFSPMVAGFIQSTHIVNVFTRDMTKALSEGDAILPGLSDAGAQFVDEFTSLTGSGDLVNASLQAVDMLYSNRVTSILAFIIVFFAAEAVCRIAINILNVAAMLPVLGSINRFFGLIFGLIEGVFMCFAVCIVVSLITMLVGDSFGIAEAIPQTRVFKWFHENNLLTAFLPWSI